MIHLFFTASASTGLSELFFIGGGDVLNSIEEMYPMGWRLFVEEEMCSLQKKSYSLEEKINSLEENVLQLKRPQNARSSKLTVDIYGR